MSRMLRGASLALLLSLAAASADAQVAGLPVYNAGVTKGIGLALDAGIPNDAAGGGWAGGATVKAGIGLVGFTASISRFDPSASDAVWSGGGTANLKVFGGPLVPLAVTLQGGVGYVAPNFGCTVPSSSCDFKQWHFPAGLGISFTIPNPALAIKPWIAPRVDVVRTTEAGASNTDAGFGISGGIELNTLSGLGVHAAYDWASHDGVKPSIIEAGVHYTFRLPGL